MALQAYIDQTRRLVHDPGAQAYNPTDLAAFINIARRQTAAQGQCVRVLLSGGVITAITINSAGSGYSGIASVVITGSGNQAAATAVIGGGVVTSITLTRGGWGYLAGTAITVTVTGSTGGSNATFNVTTDNSLTTVATQEVYNFATWNTLAQTNAGVSQIIGLLSLACSQGGTYKPMLTPMIWSEFQAYCRIYQNQAQNYPVYWAQYGQGVNGSVYLFPYPSQALQLDADCYCLPIDLADDTTPEAIPSTFTDAIPYYAAYLCYEDSSRKDDADRNFKIFDMFVKRARAQMETPFVPSYYGD